jgi:hypothetical protein
VKAERVAAAVAAAYYGSGAGSGMREVLRPVMAIVERAHPGVIELAGTPDKPGFAVRLAERPFPKEYEGPLREAVQAVLGRAQHAGPLPARTPGLVARLVDAIRRLFTSST